MGAKLAGDTDAKRAIQTPCKTSPQNTINSRGKSHFAGGKPADTNVETAGNGPNRCPDVLAGGPEKTALLL